MKRFNVTGESDFCCGFDEIFGNFVKTEKWIDQNKIK